MSPMSVLSDHLKYCSVKPHESREFCSVKSRGAACRLGNSYEPLEFCIVNSREEFESKSPMVNYVIG